VRTGASWFLAIALVVASLVLAPACKVGPDYTPPQTELPDAWHEAATDGLAEGEASVQTWWEVFDDPVLTDLIQRAEEANLDLHVAFYGIQAARALRGIAHGQRIPSVTGVGAADRADFSENARAPGTGEASNEVGLGAEVFWEVDVFGRIARQVEARTAALEASLEDYRDILVSVFAEVALAYIDLRTVQLRIDYTEKNIETQAQTLELTQDRFNAGLVSALDVAQAETNLGATRAELPVLQRTVIIDYNRLSVLLGQTPGELQTELGGAEGKIPVPNDEVTVGLPADLMRQRPDIRRAERDVAQATARIGVATADLYPRFSLSGLLSLQATSLSGLASGDSVTWGLGGGFRWNLFAGGRVRNRIRFQEALAAQSLVAYEQTVLFAVEEVEDALVTYKTEQQRRDRLIESVTANERSLDLVMTQYKAGIANFQNVLDTQRSLVNRQNELAASEGLVVQSLVTLYRALGGGWDPDANYPEPPLTSETEQSDSQEPS
jgi:multidrug efflux system outer membrane protein